MPYGALEIKNNLIGVMTFKIHIWIVIWNSWKLSHILWPSWLLLKFHALVVEEEWTEGERDFLCIQIIHFKCNTICFPFLILWDLSCSLPPHPHNPSCLILIRRNIKGLSLGPLTLTYWLSRSLLSTICFWHLPDANSRIYWEQKVKGW